MLISFSLFSSSFIVALLLICITNPKLGDRPQLWPVTVNYFHKKSSSQMFDWILNRPLLLLLKPFV